MNTDQIMQLAVDMAGFDKTPADSTIYVPGENIKKVLFGIDITTAELKMGKDLGYDLVIAHHPVSTAGSYKVYQDHAAMMIKWGVPKADAQKAVDARMEEFDLIDHSANRDHASSVARLLNIPFMNIHQPCDEIGRAILQQKVDELLEKHPEATLQEVVDSIYEIPEFQKAATEIKIVMGDPQTKAGKVVMAHGAYTNGGFDVAATYYNHGIDTVAYIHIQKPVLQRLREETKGNLIVTGHIVSDEIGIKPLVDALREKGLEVDTISGIHS